MTSFFRLVLAVAAAGLVAPTHAAVTVKTYIVDPGSTYTYYPSPFSSGIEGGQPSNYQLDFGVSGRFSVEYDDAAFTAKLFDLDLILLGNETIQNDPSFAFYPVTSANVENYLAGLLYHLSAAAIPYNNYTPDGGVGPMFTDKLGVMAALLGGRDSRPVDGDAFFFDVTATIVPEPAGLTLAALGVGAWLRRRR